MKKLLLFFTLSATSFAAGAQLLPSFQFGVKAGLNSAGVSSPSSASLLSNNVAGYQAGLWARVGVLGLNFQPEMYLTSKTADVTQNGVETKTTFTSLDVPLLVGTKIGALGIGGRLYTGPDFSFAINKSQHFSQAVSDAFSFNYSNQNLAWQFGAGLDIKAVSLDLRYEAGITEQHYGNTGTHINIFSLALAYRLIKF